MKTEYLGDRRTRTENGNEHWIENDFQRKSCDVYRVGGVEFRIGRITFSEINKLSKLGDRK